jgi:signal transduction histidine kinase
MVQSLPPTEKQIRSLYRRILSASEEEKSQIACDLHDHLGQTLIALKMDANYLNDRLASNPELRDIASNIVKTSELALTTVRRIAMGIRPDILDKLGLAKTIQWYSEDFERNTGISCPVDIIGSDFRVIRENGNTAYRIMLEALNNVVEHSMASQVDIRIEFLEDFFTILIRDNGIGINTRSFDWATSMGILGMGERARVAGGKLEVKGELGEGTCVRLQLPNKVRDGEVVWTR